MLYDDYNWTWNHWKLTGFIANSKFNPGSSKVCCDSKSFPAIVWQLIGLPLSPTSPEVFTAEKKKVNHNMLYKIPCSPHTPNTKKTLHLENPVLHLGGAAENQIACLPWTIKWCASVNTGSLFKLQEEWELCEMISWHPVLQEGWATYQMGNCSEEGEGKKCASPASDAWGYITISVVKDVPSHTGVREYVGIWCLPSCWELCN